MSDYKAVQIRTLEILEKGEADDWTSKLCDFVILVLVFLNIVAVVLESVSSLNAKYAAQFALFELVSVILFSVEYAFRIWASGAYKHMTDGSNSKGRMSYILSFHGIVDIVAILPFYLQVLFPQYLREVEGVQRYAVA